MLSWQQVDMFYISRSSSFKFIINILKIKYNVDNETHLTKKIKSPREPRIIEDDLSLSDNLKCGGVGFRANIGCLLKYLEYAIPFHLQKTQ